MFKDLIIGQYIETSSPVHRLDPAVKILMTAVFAAVTFMISSPAITVVLALLTAALIRLCGVPVRFVLGGIKPVLYLAVFAFVMNCIFTQGTELFHIWIITVTREGICLGAVYSARLIILVCAASLLTLTTAPLVLADGLERLMKPLEKIHVPVGDMAMMMTIAIRFIPTLAEDAERIIDAQRSRGAEFDEAGFTRKIKAIMPVLVPLFISAFRHSEELAEAMEARCWGIGKRTRMNRWRAGTDDIKASVLFLLLCAALLSAQYFIGKT